jgi:hypothetical protein
MKRQHRVDIDIKVVRQAISGAGGSSAVINDWNDKRQSYLTLRQRGASVKWLVRAYGKSRTIGNAINKFGNCDFLNIRAAREKAAQVYAALGSGALPSMPRPVAPPEPQIWTWADVDREYQKSLTEPRWINNRIKHPKKGTQDDCRLAFAKAPIAAMKGIKVTELKPRDIILAVQEVHEVGKSHRQCVKCLAYVKAALSWALSHKMLQSGMEGMIAWWMPIQPPTPTPDEMKEKKARKTTLIEAKSRFSVDHMGELLVEHEEFCSGKTGNEKISPGIRWGLWWLAGTANRRFSTTALERKNLHQTDPFAEEPGWGYAEWPAELMKGQADFWLPLPPSLVHVANSSIIDWRALVTAEHGIGHKDSKWAFASTRRIGRNPDNADVSIYPSSLNAHLRNLRGLKDHNKDDHLEDLPNFWLHLVRSVSSNYLNKCVGVPKNAISLMLAHSMPTAPEDMSRTTRDFYVTCQSMPDKTIAMRAWTDALFGAYEKAGGKFPMPREAVGSRGRLEVSNRDGRQKLSRVSGASA